MVRNAKFSKEIKLIAVREYIDGIKSSIMIGNELGCDDSIVRRWVKSYKLIGESAFDDKPKNKSYPRELKINAIQDYLKGEGSLDDISNKYKIYSKETLRKWIIGYNRHKEIKDYNPKGDVYMTKSRKTTYEEKLDVVKYCLNQNREYKLTAEKFELPYFQVYQWVKKYDEKGEAGLQDGRGRTKHESELSETDKLKRELELVKARNKRLEMENEVLKKQEEIERRLSSARSGKKRNT